MKITAALSVAAACICISASAQQPPKHSSPGLPNAVTAQSAAVQRPSAPPSDSAPAVPVSSTANAPEVNNPQLRPVPGQLETKLDPRTSRPGESVVVRTTATAATANGIVIPKGSKILGHVTSVQTPDQPNQNARVTLQFDKADLKGGRQLPIKSVIQAVGPDGNDVAAASPAPQVSAPADAGARPSARTLVGTVIARNGNLDIRTTAIPGVLLAADADGQPFPNASGALVGAESNLHLDGGTRLVLAVADIPLRNTR